MRINFALLRKQADIYRSKGLYKEAQDLYAGFVAHWADIDPEIRSVIEEQLQIIESEMKGGGAPAPPLEPPPEGAAPTRNGGGVGGEEPDSRSCTRGEQPAPGSGTRDEGEAKNPDWLDGMAEIYSMVTHDAEPADAQESKPEAPPGESEKMYQVLRLDPPPPKGLRQALSAKPVLIAVAAVVLLAGYVVSWFSEGEGEKGSESAQQAAAIVYKKMPVPTTGGDASAAVNTPPEGPREAPLKENPGMAEAPRVVGPVADGDVSSGEPDPASAIDYVFKKRGIDR